MTRRIRIHTALPLRAGNEVRLEQQPARHLVKVLRRRAGDPVTLFNGDGSEYQGEITEAHAPDRCSVRLSDRTTPNVESPLSITLVQAIGRGERMDWCIQKACELGVCAIVPVFSERTEVRLSGQRAARRLAHWQGVAVAAAEQSGRVRVPEIHPPVELTALKTEATQRYFLDPGADVGPSSLSLDEPPQVVLAIGPEGGFSDRELDWLRRHDFGGLRLGPRVLRTETAGPAAVAALQTLFGDWQ